MAETKDYRKEFVETEQGQVPVDTALGLLRYYYQEDILLALYDFAYEHQDEYVFGQIRAFRKRRLQGRKNGPVASPGNLPRSDARRNAENESAPLNFFAPTKNLMELLKEVWFKEVRTSGKYNEQWTDGFISALMTTEWKDDIARDWAIKGKRNKRNQIKGHIVGLLADGDVLKGSYDSIAAKVGVTDEPRSFSRYMGEGKNQPYAEWVKNYINEQK